MSNDTLRMDVAGSLFTSMYRNVKIKGEAPAVQNLDGTGSVSSQPRQQRCESPAQASLRARSPVHCSRLGSPHELALTELALLPTCSLSAQQVTARQLCWA